MKTESKITGFEKELDDYADQLQTSTPKPGKAEPLLGTKQLKLGIPAGRPDDTQKSGTEAEELNTPDNHDQPDRFLTYRKNKPNSTVVREIMMKRATFEGSGSWMDYKAHF